MTTVGSPYELKEQDLDRVAAGRAHKQIAVAVGDDSYAKNDELDHLNVVTQGEERVSRHIGKPAG